MDNPRRTACHFKRAGDAIQRCLLQVTIRPLPASGAARSGPHFRKWARDRTCLHVQDPEGKCATLARLALQKASLKSQSNHTILQWLAPGDRSIEEGRQTAAFRFVSHGNSGMLPHRGPFARNDFDRRCLYQAQQRIVDDRATSPAAHLRLAPAVPCQENVPIVPKPRHHSRVC